MSAALELAMDLIRRPSVTPDDAGCQSLIADRLAACGFSVESMPFGEVSNLWARIGNSRPVVCLAGHTDVVPPGPASSWNTDPFKPVVDNGYLYGRGAADMKGGVAAMVVAAESFTRRHPGFDGSIAFLLTSDEEGPAVDGTRCVLDALDARGNVIDFCIVGEPSSDRILGDQLRNGRRGSLTGHIDIHGVQGHVAYADLARNAVHYSLPALSALAAETWDDGGDAFPPTGMQIVSIDAGTGAENVIPGALGVTLNFRYSDRTSADELKTRVRKLLEKHGVEHSIAWKLMAEPFLTRPGPLTDYACDSAEKVTGNRPSLSTGGGTSDARFFAASGVEVIELGLVNSTIHKANECTRAADIDALAAIYAGIIERLLGC